MQQTSYDIIKIFYSMHFLPFENLVIFKPFMSVTAQLPTREVITDASSGLGEAILKPLAVKGITVIGLARRSEKIEENSRAIEGSVFACKCDVSEFASIKNAFKFRCIHILIRNESTLVCKKITHKAFKIQN